MFYISLTPTLTKPYKTNYLMKLKLLFIICIITSVNSFAQIPTEGLVGNFSLDVASIVDEIDYTNSAGDDNLRAAQTSHIAIQDRFGSEDSAIQMTNSEHLFAQPGIFRFIDTNAFTLSTWINLEQAPNQFMAILNNFTGFDQGGYYFGITDTGNLLLNLNFPGTTTITSNAVSYTHLTLPTKA